MFLARDGFDATNEIDDHADEDPGSWFTCGQYDQRG